MVKKNPGRAIAFVQRDHQTFSSGCILLYVLLRGLQIIRKVKITGDDALLTRSERLPCGERRTDRVWSIAEVRPSPEPRKRHWQRSEAASKTSLNFFSVLRSLDDLESV